MSGQQIAEAVRTKLIGKLHSMEKKLEADGLAAAAAGNLEDMMMYACSAASFRVAARHLMEVDLTDCAQEGGAQ